MAKGNLFKHWPTMLLGVVVAVILLIAVFSYQLNETETAVVVTFGEAEAVNDPGLHFRWPFPFQKVHKFDHRIRCFEGSAGKIEETPTSDQQNILVGIYVNYRIIDAKAFFEAFTNMIKAEEELNSLMRGAKNSTIGQYRFNQIINDNKEEKRLTEIQEKIRETLSANTARFGIDIVSVGINTINIPEGITGEVIGRMVADRNAEAEKFLSLGTYEANSIRTAANEKRNRLLADAEAEAKRIRAEGDAEAAKYYAVFQENPELAEFLRKMESLRAIMKQKTVLVVDTNMTPFDLFNQNATQFGPVRPAEDNR